MPISVPDGLSTLIDCGIKHKHITANKLPWYTTYQFAALTEFTPANVVTLLEQVAGGDSIVHSTRINILDAYGRRHFPKTTEPLGDSVTYNPTNHVTFVGTIPGLLNIGDSEELKYDQVVDFLRGCEFGNPGKIEVRGSLNETNVVNAFGGNSFDDLSYWYAKALDWFGAVLGSAAASDCIWVIAGEPLLTKVRSVVDNKFKEVRTYGDTIIRAVNSYSVAGPRTDKGASKFFNTTA